MKIAIISAQTGNGHNSVMYTLKNMFCKHGYKDIDVYPDFYEQLMISNRILSNYYNFLMTNSTELCNKFCEFSYMTRSDLSEEFYLGVKDKIYEFLRKDKHDIIISVSHTINYAMIRAIKELKLTNKIKYYIVITDPYEPISVGFAIVGADRYYCTSNSVKMILNNEKILDSDIKIIGYPISSNYNLLHKNNSKILQKLKFNKNYPIILINSGSNGTYHYISFLKSLSKYKNTLQIIFICGNNPVLYKQANRYISKNKLQNRVKIFGFVENLYDYLSVSNLVLSKAGANSFFEALSMEVPIIVDATHGFLFQEKGVEKFIRNNNNGIILYDENNLISVVEYMLETDNYSGFVSNIKKINYKNGSKDIINDIINISRS